MFFNEFYEKLFWPWDSQKAQILEFSYKFHTNY